ncbi:fatty acyl-AMP ligase [Streptomyces rubiginosohelvolus]|uniref:fatty acyl-AMP ligase n=1 Tax=Streptomyces rubiginosohelvolus TaxID=67362 RepID=UPI0036C1881C
MSRTGPQPTADVRTVPDALRLRSEKQPDEIAFVHLLDGEVPHEVLTYRELHDLAGARAAAFATAGLAGRSALLMYPTGLEFVRTVLGCMYGRVAGAPVQVPRRREEVERMRRTADDAGTSTVLTTAEAARDLQENFGGLPDLAGLTLLATDTLAYDPDASEPAPPCPEDIALLQYTSGSTGSPKGVMVTHANFLANAAETDEAFPCGPDGTVVNWLPHFHDMGMLFGIVMPLWAGIPSYLMAPEAFIRRPARWLEAIARFGGTHSAAPSFAYELCARAAAEGKAGDIGDLSRWRSAANGAEPVRWAAIRSFTEAFAPYGFNSCAMSPGYGLAENTLKTTASGAGVEPTVLWVSGEALAEGTVRLSSEAADGAVPLVGNGSASGRTRVRIVDPVTRRALPEEQVGEIWIDGPCTAAGYLGRAEETEETFRARLTGEGAPDRPHLRTGDLGFLHGGELYVAGRLKDLIVRKGRNHYPQDFELTAERAVPGLHPNSVSAFSTDDGLREKLVLVVEADGRLLNSTGAAAVRARVYDAVRSGHRITPDDIVIVRRGALPKTSSGKVQRRECRRRYERGELRIVAAGVAAAAAAGKA